MPHSDDSAVRLRLRPALLAVLLAGAALPVAPAVGQQSCPEAPFEDRTEIPLAHLPAVDCAVHEGIVAGYPDGSYRPAVDVRRDQMATFIARALDAAGVALPEGADGRFSDTAGNPHARNINRLADAGIVAGRSATSYDPAAPVRRDQAASFLLRAAAYGTDASLAELHSDRRQFDDVGPDNAHFENVNGAAEQQLVSGNDGRYRPAMATRRDQMASLVIRLLRYVEGGAQPPPASASISFASSTTQVGVALWSAAVGDVTGNGRSDVLVTSGDGTDDLASSLFVLVQRSDGTLAPPLRHDLSGKDVCCNARQMGIAIGDLLGGDGNEVVVATARGLDVLRWDGSGMVRSLNLDVSGIPQHVRMADMDGDGRNDIIVRMGDRLDVPGGVVVLHQTAEGFVETRVITAAHHWQGALEVEDMDGDGRPDVLMTHNELIVALQQPDATFSTTSYQLAEYAKSFTTADVTGDDSADVIVTYSGNSPTNIDVFANDGAGRLAAPQQHATYQLPNTVKNGDFNASGRDDLAVMHSGGYNAVGIYEQTADGLADEQLRRVPEYTASHHYNDAMAIGDVNGDRRADIVAADGSRILIMRNTTGQSSP